MGRSGRPVGGADGRKAPSEAELLGVISRIKQAHPDYGVKRVFNTITAEEAGWKVTERRIQRIMRAQNMTGPSRPAKKASRAAPRDDDDDDDDDGGDQDPARWVDEDAAGALPRAASFDSSAEPSRPWLFPEDCVCSAKKPSQFGWVLRAAGVLGGEDDEYYDDDGGDDDEARSRRDVPDGMARVQWLDKYEPSLERIDALRCVDRPFVAGDVVARKADPVGTLGTIARVELRAELRIVHRGAGKPATRAAAVGAGPAPAKKPRGFRGAARPPRATAAPGAASDAPAAPPAAEAADALFFTQPLRVTGRGRARGSADGALDADASRLRPATRLRMGDPVVHRARGRWVGRVVGATYDVTVRTPTGAVCVVANVGDAGVEASNTLEPLDDADYGFDELCPFFPGQRVSAPPSVWRRATWRLGRAPPGRRRRHGTVEHVAVAQAGVQWLAWGAGASQDAPSAWSDAADVEVLKAFAGLTRVGDHVAEASDDEAAEPVLPRGACAQVVRTATRCVVRWSSSAGAAGALADSDADDEFVSSLDLVPRQNLGEHDFLPNDFVVRRGDDDDESVDVETGVPRSAKPEGEAVGVVRHVDMLQRTCVVRWLGAEIDGAEAEADEPETLSAYELALHAAFNFSAGDLVLRLAAGAALGAVTPAASAYSVSQALDGSLTRDAAGAVQMAVLPEDADAQSEREAHDLAEAIRLSLLDQTAAPAAVVAAVAAADPRAAANWVGQVFSLVDGKVKVLWLDGSYELVAPTLLLVVPDARAAEEAAYEEEDDSKALEEDVDDDDDDAWSDDGAAPDGALMDEASDIMPPPGFAPPPLPAGAREDDDAGDDDDAIDVDDDDDGGDSAFAVLEGDAPADHAYASAVANKVALPAVRRLWSQLQKSLPEGVVVRAFQQRSDLLRVLIVGPRDTPYGDLLFVFDLQLPAAYPKEPPVMHYHAQNISERLNPNLYENGKVCLSLLGTWSGPGWDAATSTVLQLLVSVQGLVLVDKPYYNEPGNEKHANTVEGEQQAKLYNENARLLSLQATTAIARRPPASLKSAIDRHFEKRGTALVDALERAAADGDDATYSDGFKRVLRRLLANFKKAIKHEDAAR